jgi:NTP pyrophosphatase (non-canonical NTP hydrolase)
MLRHNDSCTELLTILQEECAEVIQMASKLKRFGQDHDTLERFAKELGDLQCMIDLCQEYDLVSYTDLDLYSAEKRIKLKSWSDLVNED